MADQDPRFDPHELTASASLNQTVISHRLADPEVRGRRAGEVCSRDALAEMALKAGALSRANPGRLADQLVKALRSEQTREPAAAVLGEFGRRLGALIATLAQGPGALETSVYRRAYLSHWTQVEAVSLAGGLLASGTAEAIFCGVEEVLHRAGVAPPARVLPFAPYASLLGAARLAPSGAEAAVIADLGHTRIKTAIAVIKGGAVRQLAHRRSVPAPQHPDDALTNVLDAVTGAVRRSIATPGQSQPLTFSVASYVREGVPVDDGRSVYARLGRHLEALEAGLAAAVGHRVTVRFVHDGTAAAVAADQGRPGGVISLGSRLAVGFTPTFGNLLDLSPVAVL